MATRCTLLRSQTLVRSHIIRSLSTSSASHQFLQPEKFLKSWNRPNDPKEANIKLAQLRRDYAKKVKEVRKEYIHEMELQMLEKQRKDEAKRETLRIANEERKAAKAATKKALAAQRELADQQLRQTLMKERAEKLEYWRMREKKFEENKKDKNEHLRRKSSMWIDESELEKKLMEVIVDITPL